MNTALKKSLITGSLLSAMLSTLTCTAASSTIELESVQKKNVLLIISDDLNMNLGTYGKEYMVTPNIDKLASQGIKFNHAYVQQSVCSASRASLLSGLRPDTTGVDYPYSHYFVNTVTKKVPLLSSYFKQNGYDTRHFGKVHHGQDIEQLSTPHFAGKQKNWGLPENQKLMAKPGGKKNFPPYESAPVADNFYRDGQVADAAVSALKQVAGAKAPFFMAVGFQKPHLPFRSPTKYWDLYDADKLPLAENPSLPVNAPEYSTTHYALGKWKSEVSTTEKNISDAAARKLRHAYYAAISYMDAQVGKVLDELEKQGLKESTIVMFISDHGWHLGEQGGWGKTTNFENATQAPMILSVPGLSRHNSETDALVEYVDIYPSLVDLAGLSLPTHLEGTSVRPVLKNPSLPWKKAAFSQFPRGVLSDFEGYAMRTEQFRYIEWRDNKTNEVLTRELYDHHTDPLESVNLAKNVEHALLVKALSKQLNAGWKAALPAGISNHSVNALAPPAYAVGKEGVGRRKAYVRRYGKAPQGAVDDTGDMVNKNNKKDKKNKRNNKKN